MSVIKHVTLQKIVAHDLRYDPRNIIRRMRFALWITKATGTHSEYITLLAFARQQWLCERASILRLYIRLSCAL